MITNEIIKKIEDFVYVKPRSVQEIAEHINKNWRTADRYISEIENNFGTISSRVFREGTRGALKIVFWSSVEKLNHSVFQKILEENILKSRKKEDFSSFDIFQYVKDSNKEAYFWKNKIQKDKNMSDYSKLLSNSKKQILIFSGNLSFINETEKEYDMFKVFDDLVKRNTSIKVICRVDLAGKNNVEKLLSLNFKHGKEVIEIRHHDQPLRGAVVDKQFIRLKEVVVPTLKSNELQSELNVAYFIKDKEWAEWLSSIFWKMFSYSIDAKKRIAQLERLKGLG